jgi:hypothetical protein
MFAFTPCDCVKPIEKPFGMQAEKIWQRYFAGQNFLGRG